MADTPDKVRFGKYYLHRRLAKGGMAEIFLASPVKAGQENQRLVIKRLLPQFSEEEEFLHMFLEEARLASQLNHPSVVRIYDLGQQDEHLYIAMEYIDGKDLESVSRGRKQILAPAMAARIIVETLSALGYAHTATDVKGRPLNIVHRDVTPENIMLSRQGGVKLVDFGVAKATTKLGLTRPGVVKGKLSYMAPEHIQGKELDGRADLFALGATLYEVTTGIKPFERAQMQDTVAAILRDKPPSPDQIVPGYPPALAAIVMRALEKDRDKRFANAAEMKAELERFLARAGKPIGAAEIAALVDPEAAAAAAAAGGGHPEATRPGALETPPPVPRSRPPSIASARPPTPAATALPPQPPPARGGTPAPRPVPPAVAKPPPRPAQAAAPAKPRPPAPAPAPALRPLPPLPPPPPMMEEEDPKTMPFSPSAAALFAAANADFNEQAPSDPGPSKVEVSLPMPPPPSEEVGDLMPTGELNLDAPPPAPPPAPKPVRRAPSPEATPAKLPSPDEFAPELTPLGEGEDGSTEVSRSAKRTTELRKVTREVPSSASSLRTAILKGALVAGGLVVAVFAGRVWEQFESAPRLAAIQAQIDQLKVAAVAPAGPDAGAPDSGAPAPDPAPAVEGPPQGDAGAAPDTGSPSSDAAIAPATAIPDKGGFGIIAVHAKGAATIDDKPCDAPCATKVLPGVHVVRLVGQQVEKKVTVAGGATEIVNLP